LAAGVVSRTLSELLASGVAVDEIRLVFFDAQQMASFVTHQQFPR